MKENGKVDCKPRGFVLANKMKIYMMIENNVYLGSDDYMKVSAVELVLKNEAGHKWAYN